MSDSIPNADFDKENTDALRRLNLDLMAANQAQARAQAISDALANRAAGFQKTLPAAQARAASATANLATGQSVTQNVMNAVPAADAAKTQADTVVDAVQPVLAQAYNAAREMIKALGAIDVLEGQVKQRQGKSELTSAVVVSDVLQSQADGRAAVAAITTALQNVMLAVAAAEEARQAANQIVGSGKRLAALLAPGNPPFNPLRPADGGLWPVTANGTSTEPLYSIRDLSRAVAEQDVTILAVLDSLAAIQNFAANEEQDAATQTAIELNAANDTLNINIAQAKAAAAVAAAEAAVA